MNIAYEYTHYTRTLLH